MNRLSSLLLSMAVVGCGAESQPADASQSPGADAGSHLPTDAGAELEPSCRRFSKERRPFFGDLHVHTALSLDANLQGTQLRPRDAYRFAKGERVGLPPYDSAGKPQRTLRIDRPLDFVALSDHAEFLGLVTSCTSPGQSGYDSAPCRNFREHPDTAFIELNARLSAPQGSAHYGAPCSRANGYCGAAALSTWKEVQAAARNAQDSSDACTFTSFVAYEWSASPGTQNLHRNVIFRNEHVPELPFTYFDGSEEEELWTALERDCVNAASGCDVLTIPHNSNLSNGLMFEPIDRQQKAIDRAYATRRARFEPLVEIFQHKGSSECVPALGSDEECSFELVPFATLAAVALGGPMAQPKAVDFVRDALGQGLVLGQKLGVNPFTYGFVGSTDSHLGTPGAVAEASFAGHGGAGSNARTRPIDSLADSTWLNPGGLAVLWAEENSREALFRAMQRREAYGTSGPRMVLRVFGGSELDPKLCGARDFVAQGYAKGVPMGGELHLAGKEKPRIAVWALKDAGAAAGEGMLERIELIKGTLERGVPRYRVIELARSAASPDVDTDTCLPNGQGADELCAVFTDDDYEPGQPAFYYARVLEAPSCRWQARACLAAKIDCSQPDTVRSGFEGCCGDAPKVVRERAWSSPIFVGAR